MTREGVDLREFSRHAYGRLRSRLEGLTEEEYRWVPGPGVSTLAWRVGHIAELLTEERNATWLGVGSGAQPIRAPMTARDAVETLDAAMTGWMTVLAEVPDATLGDPIGPVGGAYSESTRRSFVLHVLDELIHHGAEVALVRDLWAARHPDR